MPVLRLFFAGRSEPSDPTLLVGDLASSPAGDRVLASPTRWTSIAGYEIANDLQNGQEPTLYLRLLRVTEVYSIATQRIAIAMRKRLHHGMYSFFRILDLRGLGQNSESRVFGSPLLSWLVSRRFPFRSLGVASLGLASVFKEQHYINYGIPSGNLRLLTATSLEHNKVCPFF